MCESLVQNAFFIGVMGVVLIFASISYVVAAWLKYGAKLPDDEHE